MTIQAHSSFPCAPPRKKSLSLDFSLARRSIALAPSLARFATRGTPYPNTVEIWDETKDRHTATTAGLYPRTASVEISSFPQFSSSFIPTSTAHPHGRPSIPSLSPTTPLKRDSNVLRTRTRSTIPHKLIDARDWTLPAVTATSIAADPNRTRPVNSAWRS